MERSADRADLALAMAAHVSGSKSQSGADVLLELRKVFPDTPLALRVAALALARQRQRSSQAPR